MEFIEKLMKVGNPVDLGYIGIFGTLIQFHILFGLISLVTGFTILALTKGDSRHKKIGRVFVIVMMGNFLVGVPLGTFGQLVVEEPASIMTVVGALFVGTTTFSGYRLGSAGTNARAWYDKAMLCLQMLTASLYFYVAVLMVAGTGILGLTAFTLEGEQWTLLDNRFYVFEQNVALVGTTSGTVFAIIISEQFLTPLFLSAITCWFCRQDWIRIRGQRRIERSDIIHQHLTRLVVALGASVSAVLLNTSWISLGMCWSLPAVCALGLSVYIRNAGSRQPAQVSEASI